MSGSVNKARIILKEIRKNIDDLILFANGDPTKLALIKISSDLCDLLTMLVEEAQPIKLANGGDGADSGI